MTDTRDNQTYKTIKVGGQWWMSENLNFKSDSSWVYDNAEENSEKYGRLYNWASAMTGCPAGWHLPTDEEWMALEIRLGMNEDETERSYWRGNADILGNRLKAHDQAWGELTGLPSGFNAVPGGFYKQMVIAFAFKKNKFKDAGLSATYWTATPKSKKPKGDAWYRYIDKENAGIFRGYNYKLHAYAVRCVKD
ncbi:MAG: fibrobacter succinogenes major paralogous domain-containing protein [Roseivirga sp.]